MQLVPGAWLSSVGRQLVVAKASTLRLFQHEGLARLLGFCDWRSVTGDGAGADGTTVAHATADRSLMLSPAIVLERGMGTLSTFLASHAVLSANDCMRITRGILCGLAHLHAQSPHGFIHFDVTPGTAGLL